MRVVIQRVSRAAVEVEGEIVGAIGPGLLILLGVGNGDGEAEAEYLADKIANLRIFEDAQGKFNLSAYDVNAEMLVVSQFTLLADTRRGRRPSFTNAAPPDQAEPLCDYFSNLLRQRGFRVATGRFGAMMHVSLVNTGPVTIVIDTDQREEPRRK